MKRIVSSLALALAMLASSAALAVTTTYRSTMSGPGEATPVPSPGAGIATIIVDDLAMTMSFSIPFMDLLSPSTAAHLHCCTPVPLTGTAGVALPFNDFPLGVTAGLYTQTFNLLDAATYAPAFITANGGTVATASAYLLNGIAMNNSYLNIHSSAYPGGEIRGFLVAMPIPEPSTWLMLGVGLAGIGFCVRRKRV